MSANTGSKIARVARSLSRALAPLEFGPPVTHVYDPLDYAWQSHRTYLDRFAHEGCEALLVGMNPGPWGMAQTGVPFGEVGHVRDWLHIEAEVKKPATEHPKRPVEGLRCQRSEVSGQRLWGWAKQRFATPERFFARFFVWNYCPLSFMEESGKNRTPDKLPAAEREPLFVHCDAALRAVTRALDPRIVVGIGVFAEKRARAALAAKGVEIGRMLHPSPASPLANREWPARAERDLEALGLRLPSQG